MRRGANEVVCRNEVRRVKWRFNRGTELDRLLEIPSRREFYGQLVRGRQLHSRSSMTELQIEVGHNSYRRAKTSPPEKP
jgi:hypothetical protein